MSVGEICNREVVVVDKDGTIQEVVDLMRQFHVGDVVVVEEQGGQRIPVGIVTDRDIVVEVLAEKVDADSVAVKDIMSYDLYVAREEDGVRETLVHMRSRGVRRVPVVDTRGALVGILTVDDLIDTMAEQMADLAHLLLRQPVNEQARRVAQP